MADIEVIPTKAVTMKDLRTICDEAIQLWDADCDMDGVINEMRATLAQPEPVGPTVMEIIAMADEIEEEGLGQVDLVRRALARWGRPAIQPVPEVVGPSDEEIMELMPKEFRDDLATAASCVAPSWTKAAGSCRVVLNAGAVAHCRAVLARWGRLTPQRILAKELLEPEWVRARESNTGEHRAVVKNGSVELVNNGDDYYVETFSSRQELEKFIAYLRLRADEAWPNHTSQED
jgi:hypothetical protein